MEAPQSGFFGVIPSWNDPNGYETKVLSIKPGKKEEKEVQEALYKKVLKNNEIISLLADRLRGKFEKATTAEISDKVTRLYVMIMLKKMGSEGGIPAEHLQNLRENRELDSKLLKSLARDLKQKLTPQEIKECESLADNLEQIKTKNRQCLKQTSIQRFKEIEGQAKETMTLSSSKRDQVIREGDSPPPTPPTLRGRTTPPLLSPLLRSTPSLRESGSPPLPTSSATPPPPRLHPPSTPTSTPPLVHRTRSRTLSVVGEDFPRELHKMASMVSTPSLPAEEILELEKNPKKLEKYIQSNIKRCLATNSTMSSDAYRAKEINEKLYKLEKAADECLRKCKIPDREHPDHDLIMLKMVQLCSVPRNIYGGEITKIKGGSGLTYRVSVRNIKSKSPDQRENLLFLKRVRGEPGGNLADPRLKFEDDVKPYFIYSQASPLHEHAFNTSPLVEKFDFRHSAYVEIFTPQAFEGTPMIEEILITDFVQGAEGNLSFATDLRMLISNQKIELEKQAELSKEDINRELNNLRLKCIQKAKFLGINSPPSWNKEIDVDHYNEMDYVNISLDREEEFNRKVSTQDVQKIALLQLIYRDRDANAGNVMIVPEKDGKLHCEPIDAGQTTPLEFLDRNAKNAFWWQNMAAVKAKVLPDIKKQLSKFDVEKEALRLRTLFNDSKFPLPQEPSKSGVDDRLDVFRAHAYVCKVAIEANFTLEEIRNKLDIARAIYTDLKSNEVVMDAVRAGRANFWDLFQKNVINGMRE